MKISGMSLMKNTAVIIITAIFLFSYVGMTGMDANFAHAAAKHRGVCKVGSGYCLYTAKGKKVKRNKTIKGVKYYISSDKKHRIRARVYRNKYYYPNGVIMTKADKKDFLTQLKAESVLKVITDDSMSKYKKLRVCFEWIAAFPHVGKRVYKRTADWPAVYADDHFTDRTGGTCQSDAAAMAYLAHTIGYKDVYICAINNYRQHTWAQINGKVFDPYYAMVEDVDTYFDIEYGGSYKYRPQYKVKIPYYSSRHNKNGKKIPKKTKSAVTEKKTSGKKVIEKWSKDKRKLLYNDGTRVKGIVYWKKKFHAFTKEGIYRKTFTERIRKAAIPETPAAALLQLLGKPVKEEYTPSCRPEGGDDGILYYDQFTVFVFRPYEGEVIFTGVE